MSNGKQLTANVQVYSSDFFYRILITLVEVKIALYVEGRETGDDGGRKLNGMPIAIAFDWVP